MRTLVIADIHGHLAALDAILAAVAPAADDTLVLLGDYIDRGPHSAQVIDRLLELRRRHSKLIALLGNHEQMLLGARSNHLLYREWVSNGGEATLASYGRRNTRLEDLPAAHWDFLQSLSLYHEDETCIFVHASVDPILAMPDQPEYALLWDRFLDPPPHISGKVVICGHTPAREVRNVGHAMCLDTGIFRHDGLLTCLEIPTRTLIQSTQRGHIRRSHLPEPG